LRVFNELRDNRPASPGAVLPTRGKICRAAAAGNLSSRAHRPILWTIGPASKTKAGFRERSQLGRRL